MQEFVFFLSDKKKEKKLKTEKYIGARIASSSSTRDMLNISFPFFYIIHIYEMYELYN